MTHLNITQGSTVETVSALIILKLYEIALTVSEPLEGETDAAYMSGHISVPHTYREYVEYLAGNIGLGSSGVVTSRTQNPTGRFQDLTIDVTNGIYIKFADPLVESILADVNNTAYFHGDGTGITEPNAALITSLLTNNGYSRPFSGKAITTFNELPLFVNLKTIGSYCFNGCTSLTSVDLSNIETIESSGFYNCSALANVGNTTNLKSIGPYAFCSCSSLTSIDLSNVEYIDDGAFAGCTNLTSADFSSLKDLKNISCDKVAGRLNFASLETFSSNSAFVNWKSMTHIDSFGTITSIPNGAQFAWTDRLVGITLPATLTTMGENNFTNMLSNLRYIRVLATTPPTLPTTGNDISNKQNLKVYVPDASVSAYKAANGWNMFEGKIFSLTQFATDFPDEPSA